MASAPTIRRWQHHRKKGARTGFDIGSADFAPILRRREGEGRQDPGSCNEKGKKIWTLSKTLFCWETPFFWHDANEHQPKLLKGRQTKIVKGRLPHLVIRLKKAITIERVTTGCGKNKMRPNAKNVLTYARPSRPLTLFLFLFSIFLFSFFLFFGTSQCVRNTREAWIYDWMETNWESRPSHYVTIFYQIFK